MNANWEPVGNGAGRSAGPPAWTMMAAGVVAGIVLALGAVAAWGLLQGSRATPSIAPRAEGPRMLDCFRLPWGGAREMLLVPAGPDGVGEPGLAARLYPGEEPERRLASLVLANVSGAESWDVDLTSVRLVVRAGAAGDWEPIATKGAGTVDGAPALRLRSLGYGDLRFTLEPGSLRHVLVALPPNRGLSDLTDVKWGEERLVRDRLDVETVRQFRHDPGSVAQGR